MDGHSLSSLEQAMYHPILSLCSQVKLAENFNGADLRNICTEAGMFAIRDERDYTVQDDFMKAVRKLVEAKKLESTLRYIVGGRISLHDQVRACRTSLIPPSRPSPALPRSRPSMFLLLDVSTQCLNPSPPLFYLPFTATIQALVMVDRSRKAGRPSGYMVEEKESPRSKNAILYPLEDVNLGKRHRTNPGLSIRNQLGMERLSHPVTG
jgi:hypothetical protein